MKNFLKNNKILLTSIFAAVCVIVLVATLVFALAGNEANSGSDEILSSDISSAPGSSEPVSSEVSADASDESLSSEPEKEKFAPLVITSPTKTDITISESRYAITGTSDPKIPLLLNGKEVSRAETGDFSIDVELKGGANTFKFEYNGKKQTYTIRYNFTIIKSFAPSEKQSYEAGSTFVAVAVARVDCASVKATFNGKTITLSPKSYEEGEEFTEFTGSFDLPKGNEKNLNLGSVKFTATCNGLTRTYTSPSITCLRDKALDRSQIVEIVASQAETFNGNTTDDWSRPTNSYLPEGTLDYRVGGIVYDTESGNSYYKLRCGKRVYVTKKNAPDTNKVTVSKLAYERSLFK